MNNYTDLSIFGIPEYHTVLLSIRLVECVHHCVREISPLKITLFTLYQTKTNKEYNHSTKTDVQLFNAEEGRH